MCPHGNNLLNNRGLMDEKTFMKVVDEICLWEPKPILAIYSLGEPFVHPLCFEFIRYAKSKKLMTSAATSGFSLDKEKAIELAESGMDEIRFSFEGESPELYEKIRRGSNYNRVLENIQYFLNILAKRDIKMVTDILVIKHSKGESLDVSSEFKSLFNSIYDVNFYSYYPTNWRNTIKKVFLDFTEKHAPIKKVCKKFYHVTVRFDGSIVYCDLDYNSEFSDFHIGNTSLMEFINSTERNEIINKMKEGRWAEIPFCKECSAPYTVLNRERLYETNASKDYLQESLQTMRYRKAQGQTPIID
jgi:radical SAM protein with 4Fe4S-binding SPASM domain